MIALILTSVNARAGALSNICRRVLESIITDDPTQYEQTDVRWIEREIDRLSYKETWGKLIPKDAHTLALLRSEMQARAGRAPYLARQNRGAFCSE